MRAGLPASALEYIDETMLGVISKMSPGVLPSGVEAALIVEVETLDESLDDALATVEALVRDAGGTSRRAQTPAAQTEIWEARRTSGGAFGLLFPDSYTHDFAVPATASSRCCAASRRSRRRTTSTSSRSRTWATATSIRSWSTTGTRRACTSA